MADGAGRMIFLGFGKYARADKIYAVEPIVGKDRGGGHRTRVWIEGVPDPIIAGRTERTILHDMGQDAAMSAPIIDEATEARGADRRRRRQGPRRSERSRSPGAAPAREDLAPRRRREALLALGGSVWSGRSDPAGEADRPGSIAFLRGLTIDLTPLRQSRDFRRLWFGNAISLLGSMLTTVAIPYQVYQLTGSTLAVGLLGIAALVPLLTVSFLGGAIADALDRRLLLILSDIGLAAISGLLVANAALADPRLWALYAAEALGTAFYAIQRPAMDALVPRLVGEENIASAAAVQGIYSSFGHVGGPAIGGILIASVGLTATYAIDVVTFTASLIAALLLPKMPPLGTPSRARGSRAIAEGFRFVRQKPELKGIFAVDTIAMIFGMPSALFPAFAEEFGGGAAHPRLPLRGAVRRRAPRHAVLGVGDARPQTGARRLHRRLGVGSGDRRLRLRAQPLAGLALPRPRGCRGRLERDPSLDDCPDRDPGLDARPHLGNRARPGRGRPGARKPGGRRARGRHEPALLGRLGRPCLHRRVLALRRRRARASPLRLAAGSSVKLRRDFFARSVHEVAPELVGATLLVDGVGGRIVEVEAYDHEDPGRAQLPRKDGAQRLDVRPARARVRLPLVRRPLVPEPRVRGRKRRSRPSARADARARRDGRRAEGSPSRGSSPRARGAWRRRSASRASTTACRSTGRPSSSMRESDVEVETRSARRDHEGGRPARGATARPARSS